ncbi:MAG: biopolymer transporter ExbD [Myxococcales bacterium]|nr:biopolymer transporter ExbD [Myxococcales bacterium]
MASISTGSEGGGRKTVDSEIPLVPFIDLLLCCVMFLLATAVWNQLARINANQQTPGQERPQDEVPPEEKVKLVLQISKDSGYVLASTAGDRTEIAKNGEAYNLEELLTRLKARKQIEPNRTDIIVAPEDGVRYEDVVATMDVVVGDKKDPLFPDLSLTDNAGL